MLIWILALPLSGCVSYQNVDRTIAIREIASGKVVHGDKLIFYHPHKIIPINSPGKIEINMKANEWSQVTLPTLTLYTHFNDHVFWFPQEMVRDGGRIAGRNQVLVIDREENIANFEDHPAKYELVIRKGEQGAVGNEGHRGAD